MKLLLLLLFTFSTFLVHAQYFPRGININDNYLPNLEEPDKWIVGLDGVFDFQNEESSSGGTGSPFHRFHFNVFYGGQVFRAGLQVSHEFKRDVKDITIGAGFTYGRPFFLEAGVGHLTRSLASTSFDGTVVNLRLGYYFNWIMHIKYRMRVRLALASSYKTINSGTNQRALIFYPLVGFEFET